VSTLTCGSSDKTSDVSRVQLTSLTSAGAADGKPVDTVFSPAVSAGTDEIPSSVALLHGEKVHGIFMFGMDLLRKRGKTESSVAAIALTRSLYALVIPSVGKGRPIR